MKVKFGLSNVHFFVLTETTDSQTGAVTMSYGAGIACPGAVNLTLDVTENENEPFYADDGIYFMPASKSGGYSGNLEVALIPDALKLAAMNYRTDEDDAMIEIAESKTIYVGFTFEIDNDEKARRLVYYKSSLGIPSVSAATTEGTKTPTTESLPITVLPTTTKFKFGTGDDQEEVAVVSGYSTPDTDATVYTNWHTAPHLPTEPTPPGP